MPNKCCIGTGGVLTFCDAFGSMVFISPDLQTISHTTEQGLQIVVGVAIFLDLAEKDATEQEIRPFFLNYCPMCGVHIIEASQQYLTPEMKKTLNVSSEIDPVRAPQVRADGLRPLTRGEVFGKGGIIKRDPRHPFINPNAKL